MRYIVVAIALLASLLTGCASPDGERADVDRPMDRQQRSGGGY